MGPYKHSTCKDKAGCLMVRGHTLLAQTVNSQGVSFYQVLVTMKRLRKSLCTDPMYNHLLWTQYLLGLKLNRLVKIALNANGRELNTAETVDVKEH